MNDGQFPVYTTESCPRNQSEWNKRSSAINCTIQNGYMCLPNDQLTELQEFCYKLPRLAITEGGSFRFLLNMPFSHFQKGDFLDKES